MASWKTTLGGILAAIGTALMATDDWKWLGYIFNGIGLLLLGLAAKDSNVTGGTKVQ
jgi:sulfite exporter TauE/SafE